MNDAVDSRHSSDPQLTMSAPPMGVFAELGQIVLTSDAESLGRVLQRVADTARSMVPEVVEVSVTLVEDGRATTIVFAGPLAAFLDERQYERGFGPCLDAAVGGGTVLLDTAEPGNAYPDLSAVAARHGINEVLAVGLSIMQGTAGALNLYASSSHPIPAETVALAETFARYASVAVANATLYQSAVEEARQLQEALRSRAVIEQAKGILMGARRCTAEQAFEMLTRASQAQNRKLRDVAADLVRRGAGQAQ